MSYLKSFFICVMLWFCAYPKLPLKANENADYIVIGLGTAGSTLTKLLSDNKKNSVIALHNGKDLSEDPDIKYTRNAAFTVLSAPLRSSFYQTGFTIPQTHANNRELFWALATLKGGASSVNAGFYDRGTQQMYAKWEEIAGSEWSVNTLLNLYKSLENYQGSTPNRHVRGFNGLLDVRQASASTPFSLKFSQAVTEATELPIIVDYNNPNTPIGTTTQGQYLQRGLNGNLRASSATAFLNHITTPDGKGIKDRKLQIKFKSRALETIWEGNKAIGVKYFQNGKIKKVFANKGIIVCAGLYSSAFLMHSGIGPNEVLAPLGIPVKFENPYVGQGLADQMTINILFKTNPEDTPTSIASECEWNMHPSYDVSLPPFIFSAPRFPDLNDRMRFIKAFLCNGFAFPENSIFCHSAWMPAPEDNSTARKVRLTTMNPFPGSALVMVDLIQPLSRGQISINSLNPFDPPIIDSGLFNNPADLDLYVQIFQTYIKKINVALHAIDKQYRMIFPTTDILNDVELLTDFVKEYALPCQCWHSHCRMAPLNQGGVVNDRGAVYGVENLYVADASIIPAMVDGLTMAPTYLIAANIARLLLESKP